MGSPLKLLTASMLSLTANHNTHALSPNLPAASFKQRCRPNGQPPMTNAAHTALKPDLFMKKQRWSTTELHESRSNRLNEESSTPSDLNITQPLKEKSFTNKPYHSEDWAKISKDPSFIGLMEKIKDGMFFLDKATVEKVLNTPGEDSLLIRNFYRGIDYLDVTETEKVILQRMIDLTQLSTSRTTYPQAIIFISPTVSLSTATQKVSQTFKGELSTQILSQLHFNETDQPQVLALDVSSLIFNQTSKNIELLFKHPQERGGTGWFGDFHLMAKTYYDKAYANATQQARAISTQSWQLYSMMFKSRILDSVTRLLPHMFKMSLPQEDEVDSIVYSSALALLNYSNYTQHTFDSYEDKVKQSKTYQANNTHLHFFDDRQAAFVDYSKHAYLHLKQDTDILEGGKLLEALFPNTHTEQSYQDLLSTVPLTPAKTVIANYRYPLKALMRAEANFLTQLLTINKDINQSAAIYSALNKPALAQNNKQGKTHLLSALKSYYETVMAESIRSVLQEHHISPALTHEPRFNGFIEKWVELYTAHIKQNTEDYPKQLSNLLNQYYPIG